MTLSRKNLYLYLGMLFIFVSVIFFFPANGQAAEVKDLKAYFDQLDSRGGDWNKNSNNDYGLLAFREAYVLQSYLLMYETYKDTKYLDKFVNHADSVLNQRDSVRKVTDYRGQSLPAWRHTDAAGDSNPLILGGKFYHVAVDTGNISYPYAWFAQIVKSDPALSAYSSKANIYVQAAKDAIGVHEDEWRESGDGGWYIYRKGSPYWCDGVGVPHNQNLGLARTMLKIYQVTGEAKYLDRVTKIARHFKNNLTLETDRYVWYYWWGQGYGGWTAAQGVSVNTPSYSGYKKYEDFRHGAVDGDFVMMAYQAGIVFDQTDVQRFANTIEKNLIRTDGKINEFVNSAPLNGSNDLLIGLWLRFDESAPSLFNASYTRASSYTSVGAPGLLVVAYMNWAYNGPGGSTPQQPDPPQDTTAPQVAISQPADGASLDLQVNVAASASDDTGVTGVEFQFSQSAEGSWTSLGSGVQGSGGWTLTWNTQELEPGTYYLRAQASDAAGNTGTSTPVTVTVPESSTPTPDTAAPQVAISQPADGASLDLQVNVAASASDDTGVTGVEFQFSQSAEGSWTSLGSGVQGNGGWTMTWNTQELEPGAYYLRAQASDAAGNTGTSAPVTVTVPGRTSPPTDDPPADSDELVVNGGFSQDRQGWSAGGSIAAESSGNKYAANSYNWQLYQDIYLQPGSYTLKASAKKGTGAEARVTVFFIDSKGNRTLGQDAVYTVKGSGWEAVPEIKFTVPASASATRIYLLSPDTAKTAAFDNISLKKIGTVPGGGDDSPDPGDNGSGSDPDTGSQPSSLIANGGFSQDRQGWSAGGSIAAESSGNKYAVNSYNWQLYQDISLQPGNYTLNAAAKKGTGAEARVTVFFIDSKGNRTLSQDVVYTVKGSGWEAVPEIRFTVPASAATTRIYLLSTDTKKTAGFDNISLKKTGTDSGGSQPSSLIANGGFSQDGQGWTAGGAIKTESNGNKYVSNSYNWQLYQNVALTPGKTYKLSAMTRKGTAGAADARIAVGFIDAAGKLTVKYDFKYRHKGTGWESIPEQTITVPSGTTITRIYLLSATPDGYHDFDNIALTS